MRSNQRPTLFVGMITAISEVSLLVNCFEEIVALSGAHGLGACHTDRSGFWGPWTRAPTTVSALPEATHMSLMDKFVKGCLEAAIYVRVQESDMTRYDVMRYRSRKSCFRRPSLLICFAFLHGVA